MAENKKKQLFINLGILIGMLLMLFTFGEILTRMLYKNETYLFPPNHAEVQYGDFTIRRVRPNMEFWHSSADGQWKFTTNNRGFRNIQAAEYEKPAGRLRILSLGDSHTLGFEVRQEYTYSAIIEKYLRREGLQADVFNTGVSGFSTAEALVFLENEGLKYRPDAVVLGFYANDYQDNIKAGLFKMDSSKVLHRNKTTHIPGVKIQNMIYYMPFTKWLSENSYFYSLLFNKTWQFFKLRATKSAKKSVVSYAVPTREKFSDYQSELTGSLIERLYRVCHDNGIMLVIIDIPRRNKANDVFSSFNEVIQPLVVQHSDALVHSDSVLSAYEHVAEIHLTHGQRHISEFTHTLLGTAAAQKITGLLAKGQSQDAVDEAAITSAR